MKVIHLTVALAVSTFSASTLQNASATESSVPIIEFPDEYRTSPATQERPNRESPQAVDGSGLTVLSPVYNGAGGNTSYLRLINPGSVAVRVNVAIVGSPSGSQFGLASLDIPPGASQQRSIHDVYRAAGIPVGFMGSDTALALYLSSPDVYFIGFQHILHNATTRAFENVSICTFRASMDYSPLNTMVSNVHTDQALMVDYPTNVSIHHYGPTNATYRAEVRVAETGELKGSFAFTLRPNETYVAPMAWYEQSVNWVPVYGQSHANLLFRRDDGPFQAVVGQQVYNRALDASVNMSQFCGLNNM